jgi:hypothetical protein
VAEVVELLLSKYEALSSNLRAKHRKQLNWLQPSQSSTQLVDYNCTQLTSLASTGIQSTITMIKINIGLVYWGQILGLLQLKKFFLWYWGMNVLFS